MKNNIVVVLLVIVIGVISGFSVLICINNAVQVGSFPLWEKTTQVVDTQRELIQRVSELNTRIASLESKLEGPINKAANAAQAAAPSQMPPAEDLNKVYDIPEAGSIIVGPKDAKVTIVEFTDLQCPYCRMFYPPVKQALSTYPKDVRLIIKNYPLSFHANARPAAKAAMAAHNQGKFIEMVELLLNNGADVSESKLNEYAKALGINADKLINDLKKNDAAYEAQIAKDMELAEKVDMRGTPTFYINGQKTNSRDFNGFKREIDRILGSK